jgi:transglutaminase-like putative cysteine protease
MEEYLCCTSFIDCDHQSVIKKAAHLTKGQERVTEKSVSLFYFVRDEIKYNPYLFTTLPENLRATATLQKGEGFCVQKAVLLAALSRSVGIPARLRFADIKNHIVPKKLAEMMPTDLFLWHGYNELHIDGKWVKVTPTFDIKMCRENQIVPVEFDGKKDSVFHSHTLDGRLHIEYIRDHGHYRDVPLDKIVDCYRLLDKEREEVNPG